jgi:hypothetical protein
MMVKFFSVMALLFVLIVTSTMKGQENEFPPCSSPVDWDRVLVTDSPLPDGAHKFLIVTNRPYIADAPKGKVLPNEVSEYRKVSYFLTACDGENWLLNPVNDFLEGMTVLDDGRDILLFVHGHGKAFPSAAGLQEFLFASRPAHEYVAPQSGELFSHPPGGQWEQPIHRWENL